jgi:TonB family protein
MKRACLKCVGCAVLLLSLASAQSSDSRAHKPGPEYGTVVNNIYANEFLGFRFPIPDGWEVNSETVGAEREGEATRTPGGGLELLIVDQHNARSFRNRIVVTALDASVTTLTTQEYVAKMVGVLVSRDGRKLVHESTQVELAGKSFIRSDYKQPVPGGELAEAFVCTKFSGYFLGWTFVAGSPEELEGLVRSLQQLSFRDEPNAMKGTILGSGPQITQGSMPSKLPQRVRVSQRVSDGLVITKVTPHYPDDARLARIQGSVILKAEIDKNGNVDLLTLISGHPMLVPSAIEAVKQWKYKPYLLNGQPVIVETQVTVAFELSAQ